MQEGKVRKKKQSRYYEGLPEDLLKWMSEGASVVQCAKNVGVSANTLHRWSKDPRKPAFTKAWDLGHEASEAYWEGQLQEAAKGQTKGNATLMLYYMKVRFKKHWLDDGTTNKLEVTTKKYEELSDDELNKVLENKLSKDIILKQLPQKEKVIN